MTRGCTCPRQCQPQKTSWTRLLLDNITRNGIFYLLCTKCCIQNCYWQSFERYKSMDTPLARSTGRDKVEGSLSFWDAFFVLLEKTTTRRQGIRALVAVSRSMLVEFDEFVGHYRVLHCQLHNPSLVGWLGWSVGWWIEKIKRKKVDKDFPAAVSPSQIGALTKNDYWRP